MAPSDVARGADTAKESVLTRAKLKQLARTQGLCVSLFAPMHTAGKDTRENPIRFKNRVAAAERQLREAGLNEEETKGLLEPALDLLGDHAFWQHQSEGFACFVAPGEHHRFLLPLSLPELTVVGEHYHLKPLIPMLMGDGRFFILAASLGAARLFEATRHHIRELDLASLDGVPTSLGEAQRFDVVEKYRGSHDVSPGQAGSETKFHGHGAGEDERNTKILEYFQQLDKGVQEFLGDERTPVVFAGVDYLYPIYRQANHYPHLMDQAVGGNPDDWPADDLLERAWPIMEPHFKTAQTDAIERFAMASSDLASTALEQVLVAAMDGRVDTLLVVLGTQQWGQFNPDARAVRFDDDATADNEDLLNLAVIYTLITGGSVYALEPERMPKSSDVAATYRF